VLFGGLNAWLYWPADPATRAIRRAGGTVQRLTAGPDSGGIAITLPDTVGDEQLEQMDALDRLRPVWLQLRGRAITGRGLSSLKRLDSLHGLTLYGSTIKNEDLVHLEAFPDLQVINVDCNLITDRGLEQIKKLPKLTSISLRGNPITAEGVRKLQADRPKLTIYSQHEPPDD
jgi:hypothetical protein